MKKGIATKKPVQISYRICEKDELIQTLEDIKGSGGHQATKGDYIVTGIQGEEYPCKPDIFVKTYTIDKEWEE